MNDNKDDKDYERHFKNTLSNYAPVFGSASDELIHKLEEADRNLNFPKSPSDVLEYLGNIDPLEFDENEKATIRKLVQKDVSERGPKYVWENKLRSKLELRYILKVF